MIRLVGDRKTLENLTIAHIQTGDRKNDIEREAVELLFSKCRIVNRPK
jgi:hypothetical protein